MIRDVAVINAFFDEEFPQATLRVEALGDHTATVRYPIDERALRPGGTVSGPVMFTAADVAMYAAILGHYGLVPLAVTTNLTINFLRKPSPEKDILAVCRLLKAGKALVVAEVDIFSDGSNEVVAHATGTYSIPPKDRR
ncbi:MAG TPA: PaaI family thioesterase [Pseudomonadales bacterium]|nr:PaaI family thioesterase [Pseudomonadales bacterium]